jgi:hypothetical protein
VLADELVVAAVGLGVGGCLGAESEDDRAELVEGLGGAAGSGHVGAVVGRADRVQQFLLLGEDDLHLVAEVAEEGGAADFGAIGDVADRDIVESARQEQLLGRLDDALAHLAALALGKRNVRGHVRQPTWLRTQFHMGRSTVWY